MTVETRARASIVKAACMALFGVLVLGRTIWSLQAGLAPEAATMGIDGFAALAVNAGVALMLYRFRSGDSNVRSVWLCSRNDAIGNVAVMLAALGVFGTGSIWPDALVDAIMSILALSGASTVFRHARPELQPVGS